MTAATEQSIYAVKVRYPDGRYLTWLHMCSSMRELLAIVKRRWGDADDISCELLGKTQAPPQAVDTAPFTGTRQGAFVGARRLANGTPVYARPLSTSTQPTLF